MHSSGDQRKGSRGAIWAKRQIHADFVFFENNSPKCERTILIQKRDPHGCPIVVRMQRMQGGQIVPESQTDVRQSE